jgi:very-short-patch-repair endonuclease
MSPQPSNLRRRVPSSACARQGALTQTPTKPTWRITTRLRSHARDLRRNMTRAERIIWQGRRAHRLDGPEFRRPTPIGPDMVDFVSHAAEVIIEVDGGQHFEDAHEAHDAARDACLRSKGLLALRFNTYEVMTNREGVLTTIAAVLGAAVAPSLSSPASQGGGEAAAEVSDPKGHSPREASP